MFLLNELKSVLSNGVIFLFAIISYFLIFRTSKQLKQSGKFKDYRIAKATGIFYGLFTVAALILTIIY